MVFAVLGLLGLETRDPACRRCFASSCRSAERGSQKRTRSCRAGAVSFPPNISFLRPFDDEELEDTGERLLALRRSQELLGERRHECSVP